MAYIGIMEKQIYTNNDQLRAGHAQLAQSMDVKLFLTLATNQQMSIEKMKFKTREFMARLDRSKLGRNWAKHDRRMDAQVFGVSVGTALLATNSSKQRDVSAVFYTLGR